MNLLSDPLLAPLAKTTLALSISAIAVGLLWRMLKPASLRLERLAWLSVLVQGWLVAQVSLQEWTADGKLRQPVFLGLRDDKTPEECRLPKEIP